MYRKKRKARVCVGKRECSGEVGVMLEDDEEVVEEVIKEWGITVGGSRGLMVGRRLNGERRWGVRCEGERKVSDTKRHERFRGARDARL